MRLSGEERGSSGYTRLCGSSKSEISAAPIQELAAALISAAPLPEGGRCCPCEELRTSSGNVRSYDERQTGPEPRWRKIKINQQRVQNEASKLAAS